MVQVIQKEPGALSTFGAGLGQGLSQGLNTLLQNKLQQLTYDRQAKGIQTILPHLTESQAREIVRQDPRIQQQFIKNELERPQREFYAKAYEGLYPQNPITPGYPHNLSNIASLLQQEQGQPTTNLLGEQRPESQNPILTDLGQQASIGMQKQPFIANELSAQQFRDLTKIQSQQEKLKTARQLNIEKKNASIVKELQENTPVAKSIISDIARARELINTGKIEWGLLASNKPYAMLNKETQELSQLYDRLALAEVAKSGRTTNYKAQMIRATKPSIAQKIPVQLKSLERLEKSSQYILDRDSAYKHLLVQNNGEEPANLGIKIDNFLKEYIDEPAGLRSTSIERQNEPSGQVEESQLLPQQQISPDELIAQQPGESILGMAGRNIVSNVVKAAQGLSGLAGIPGSIESLLPKQTQVLPTVHDVQQKVRSTAESVLPKDYLEPKNKVERAINDFAENVGAAIPFVITGGAAATLPLAERAAVGAFGTTLGREAIGGPWGELIGSLASTMGHNFWKSGNKSFFNVAKLRSDQEKNKAYKEASKVIKDKNLTLNGPEIRKALHNIYKEFEDKVSQSDWSKMTKEFSRIENAVKVKNVSAKTVWDKKVALNNAISQLKPKEILKVPFIKAYNLLTDELKKLGKSHPDFGQAFNKGESYTAGLKFMSGLTKVLDNITGSKYYLSKVILGGLGALSGKSFSPLGKLAGVYGVKKISEAVDFARSPAGAKQLAKAFAESVVGDIPGLQRTLKNIEKGVENYYED